MEEEILDLILDDYYFLWEVRDVCRRKFPDTDNQKIKNAVLLLLKSRRVEFVSSFDFEVENLKTIDPEECIALLEDEASWDIPQDGSRLIRIGVA